MSADSDDARSFEGQLVVSNETWKSYRITGATAYPSSAVTDQLYEKHVVQNPRPVPNPHTLLFFENWKRRPNAYTAAHDSGKQIARLTDLDPTFNRRSAEAQKRYREVVKYFGEPRYAVQKPLGMGGNGLAIHVKDNGPLSTVNPGRDIVVKVALAEWQWDPMVGEKKMMRKVKGSAHCVQIIEPQDIGKPEEEPVTLPLAEWDSSTESDSSGNESLTRNQVQRRHRIPKRKSRGNQYWRDRKRRREERDKEIEDEIANQVGERKDYIIMEYLRNGSLASLIIKLNERKKQDPNIAKVPNRVLWGFWLCLIRACVAMEYPPRKFHPLRKKPEIPEGAVSFLKAKANSMIRECKRLGIRIYNPKEHARMEAEYNQLEGDLIENIPNPTGIKSLDWKKERRQNMIHRDFDPSNIFIDGFELDGTALKHWEETLADKKKDDGQQGFLVHTGRRPDRLCQEHELIPRLKLGDFGMAICSKREKRNEYYLYTRWAGKSGEHPPEYFGPEWEKVEGGRDGDYLANSRTCGYYSNKTNIWNSAMTMWELITQEIGPTPPQPQPPYEMRDLYPPYNSRGQANYDYILKEPEYVDFKISYCPLLLDPDVHDYNWVDERLRKTIFECLYHKPDDRPSLEQLLREAEENIQADKFPQETDAQIRDWIQSCLLDAQPEPEPEPLASPSSPRSSSPSPPPPPPAPGPSGALPSPSRPSSLFSDSFSSSYSSSSSSQPPPDYPGASSAYGQSNLNQAIPGDPAVLDALTQDDPNNVVRQGMQAQFDSDFRNGFTRIENSGERLMCGLFALADSLTHQLGARPVINGVTHNLNLPTADDLFDIYMGIKAEGYFDAFFSPGQLAEDNNFNVDTLGLILSRWGESVGLELSLGYILGGRGGPPLHTGSPYDNPKLIWIYNNNVQDNMGLPSWVLNHYEGLKPSRVSPYEGLKPNAAPAHTDDDPPDDAPSDDDLPDYQSSD
ncbi:kinase-like domain-containing protein [Xylaria sp. FL0933]|nr:kinase-like domain-containing protein [Xylaria sp. FL0933]